MASALDTMKAVAKEHGDKMITVGVGLEQPERIPTDIFEFDFASGGGIPHGRLTEIFGPESSCKTNIVLRAMANAQKMYPKAYIVFIDAENAMDGKWMRVMGVDPERVIYIRPDYGEQVVGAVEKFLEADDVCMVVIDSTAHLVGMAELEQDELKGMPGHAAQLVQKVVKRGVKAMQRADVNHQEGSRKLPPPAMVMINQIRHKIGVMYGSPETTPGGNSPKFAAGLRVRVYGKDVLDKKISASVPARKEVNAVLVKWKVPVLTKNFAFEMNMLKAAGKVGDVNSWKTVENLLKHYGFFWKDAKKGYWLNLDHPGSEKDATSFDTIKDLRAIYDDNLEFRTTLHSDLIRAGFAELDGEWGEGYDPDEGQEEEELAA